MGVAAEAAAAPRTSIGPPTCMDLAVLAEVGAMAEGLAALAAAKGLLGGMDALVPHQ